MFQRVFSLLSLEQFSSQNPLGDFLAFPQSPAVHNYSLCGKIFYRAKGLSGCLAAFFARKFSLLLTVPLLPLDLFPERPLATFYKAIHRGKISVEKVVEKMCHNPAKIFKIEKRGFIKPGYYADLVIVNPHLPWNVKKENIL